MKYKLSVILWLGVLLLCSCNHTVKVEEDAEIAYEVVPQDGREDFLAKYGFEGRKPFYCYYDENNELNLELYYDADTKLGCGIQYTEYDAEMSGFAFCGFSQELNWDVPNPYSLLTVSGESVNKEMDGFEEEMEYNENNQICYYQATGFVELSEETDEKDVILEIKFIYREDGTLCKKEYYHNSLVFGTAYMTQTSYFDETERLTYEHSYITHGSLDNYYIYEGDSKIPSYCLSIDNMGTTPYPVLYKYKENTEEQLLFRK